MTSVFALDEATADRLIRGRAPFAGTDDVVADDLETRHADLIALIEQIREHGKGPAPVASIELRSLFEGAGVAGNVVAPLTSRRSRARRVLRVAGGMGIAAKIALGAGAAAAAIGGASAAGVLPAPVQQVLDHAIGAANTSQTDHPTDREPSTSRVVGDEDISDGSTTGAPSSQEPAATDGSRTDSTTTSTDPAAANDPATRGKPEDTPGTPPDHAGPPAVPGKPEEPGKPADTPGLGKDEAPGQNKPDEPAASEPNGNANDTNSDSYAEAGATGQANANENGLGKARGLSS
jgi:hypothetical protein